MVVLIFETGLCTGTGYYSLPSLSSRKVYFLNRRNEMTLIGHNENLLGWDWRQCEKFLQTIKYVDLLSLCKSGQLLQDQEFQGIAATSRCFIVSQWSSSLGSFIFTGCHLNVPPNVPPVTDHYVISKDKIIISREAYHRWIFPSGLVLKQLLFEEW